MEELVASPCSLMPLKTVTQDNMVGVCYEQKPLTSFSSDTPYIPVFQGGEDVS